MTVSRVRASGVLVAGVAVAALSFNVPATAQQGAAPVQLKTPQRLKPVQRTPTQRAVASPTVPGYRGKSAGRSVSGIQVNRLGAVAADAAGVLTGGDGGFGDQLWRGSRLDFIQRLLAAHPERVSSQVLRRLLRRVLLSAATPPTGAEGTGFTAIRLGALLAMGEFKAGLDLLKAVPRHSRETAFLQLETELMLVTGRAVPACRTVGTEVARRKEAFWQKALIYCQLLAGDLAKAEFGLSLLQETEGDDLLFLELAGSMVAGEPAIPKNLDRAGLLHFAMLKTADLALPLATARRYPAALIQLAGDVGSAQQLEAIEIAANDGLLGGDELRARYEAAVPPLGSQEDDDVRIQSAEDRAHLYSEAKRARIPTSKAEALRRAIESAGPAGRMGGVSRLFRPILNAIPPTNDLLWVAPSAFRTALLTGDGERAGAWLALARRHAAISPDAGKLYRDLLPLAALLQVSRESANRPPAMPGQAPSQVILFHALFRALGGDVGLEAGEALIFQSDQVVPLPDPVLWQRLRRLNRDKILPALEAAGTSATSAPEQTAAAAVLPGSGPAQKVVGPVVVAEALAPPSATATTAVPGAGVDGPRLGERILMMALAIGDRPLDAVNPVVIEEVIHGLDQAGLPAEARSLAMEVAINAGL